MWEYLNPIGLVSIGLALLLIGAKCLVKGAADIATLIGLKPIIIGLTIVAFGTSTPEAMVSLLASFKSNGDIAISNIVGSNIFNLAFIMGISALIKPLTIEENSIRREIPFVIGSAALLLILGWDRELSRLDGLLFLTLMFIFLLVCFKNKSKSIHKPTRPDEKWRPIADNTFLVVLGVGLLVMGARWTIQGALDIATLFQMSPLIIGLTLVSIGTSLPELATSTFAAYRGHDDISIGNLTGSNIFNICFILGMCALLAPLPVSEDLITRDIPVMMGVSLLVLPFLKSGFLLNRIESMILIFIYLGYMTLIGSEFYYDR